MVCNIETVQDNFSPESSFIATVTTVLDYFYRKWTSQRAISRLRIIIFKAFSGISLLSSKTASLHSYFHRLSVLVYCPLFAHFPPAAQWILVGSTRTRCIERSLKHVKNVTTILYRLERSARAEDQRLVIVVEERLVGEQREFFLGRNNRITP